MRYISTSLILIFLIRCSSWDEDNQNTQFLNDFIEEETSVEKTPLKLIKINTYGKEIVEDRKSVV